MRYLNPHSLANDPNFEKVAILDFLGLRFELLDIPASRDESACQKFDLLGRKPESKLAREVDLEKAFAYTTQISERFSLTVLPIDRVFLEPFGFRRRGEDSAWVVVMRTFLSAYSCWRCMRMCTKASLLAP